MTARSVTSTVAIAVLGVACGHAPAPSEALHARLAGGAAALVGGVSIPASLVGEVARAQRVEPRVALDLLIDDALASEGARAKGADRTPSAAWALEAIVARAAADHVRRDSLAAGPPNDAELAAVTARHWREVDLAEQFKVIHALVKRPKSPADADAARALAAQLAATEALSRSDDDFEARAKALPHGSSLEILVERLPAFVEDGRVVEGEEEGGFDPAFAKGAFALKRPGDVSGPVESSFGWHVIRLSERRPPRSLPREERRVAFAEEVYTHRGHEILTALLTAKRLTTRVEILPDAQRSMAEIATSTGP